jgi:phosphoribosyl 1,2-cyclic phosphate phosphodiesterase
LFIHDQNILFDTPEDIVQELNNTGIERVEHIFYTHWHPDHVLGARVVEQLNTTWSEDMAWRMATKSTTVIHMPGVVHDEIMQRLGVFFEFWEHIGVSKTDKSGKAVTIGNLKIEPVIIKTCHRTTTHTAIYVIQSEEKKLIYAPCDITPFPDNEIFRNADLMVLQYGWWGEEMATRAAKGPHYESSLEEILAVRQKYRPERLILTHIGDELGMTLAELEEVEKEHDFEFAYDGMKIEI